MIRRLFQKLFGWPCDHSWELMDHGTAYRTLVNYDDTKARQAFKYWIHRCPKCGTSKEIQGPRP